MKRVIVLGSTGSIGESTVDVIRSHPSLFRLVGLSAHRNEKRLLEQAAGLDQAALALSGARPDDRRIAYAGGAGLLGMIEETAADIVVNGIAGSPGLLPSFSAVRSGKDLALANKETLVMAGPLILALARENGRRLLPVDSEHSGLFMLVSRFDRRHIREIIITASGGAFRDLSRSQLETVTLEQALSHPNWSMGPKITIDSASMANKGLEVIEAVRLFDFSPADVKVVIHPKSNVHALVRTLDGSLYAQISTPDMRIPIQNALTWPEIQAAPAAGLELEGLSLSFQPVDIDKYPLLDLAYRAAGLGNGYPIAYNAANEIAVAAFMKGRLRFIELAGVVKAVLDGDWSSPMPDLEAVIDADKRARNRAEAVL